MQSIASVANYCRRAGGWRGLCEELHNLCSSPITVRKMIRVWCVAWMGELHLCREFVRKPEGKRTLKRPKHRWSDRQIESGVDRAGLFSHLVHFASYSLGLIVYLICGWREEEILKKV